MQRKVWKACTRKNIWYSFPYPSLVLTVYFSFSIASFSLMNPFGWLIIKFTSIRKRPNDQMERLKVIAKCLFCRGNHVFITFFLLSISFFSLVELKDKRITIGSKQKKNMFFYFSLHFWINFFSEGKWFSFC